MSVKKVIKIGKKQLTDAQVRLLATAVDRQIEKLGNVVAEWDALPDDAMVNGLERHVVAVAKEDIPNLKTLLYELKEAL